MAEREHDRGLESPADQFDRLAAMRGLVIPADRRDGVLSGYAELRRLAMLIGGEWGAEDEPAHVFSIESVTRPDDR